MTFRAGDIIEMRDPDDVEYAVTKPGTKWMVYFNVEGDAAEHLIRVGTLSHDGMTPEEMIARYGREHNHIHRTRRVQDNIKIFTVRIKDCQPVGNNAIFKNKLLQGDMWEYDEQKKRAEELFKKFNSFRIPF
jgi:hypothetical protein